MTSPIKILNTKEVFNLIDNENIKIIDVRTVDAYNGWRLNNESRGGHIKGAKSLPAKWIKYIDWIEIVYSKKILPEHKIVVYGYSEDEINGVTKLFLRAGYSDINVYNDFVQKWTANKELPMIAPSLFNDANGDYRGTDKEVHKNAKFENHSIFSLWDTYRAAHPLFTLVQPNRVNGFINSMLAIYEQQGKLPIWHLKGNETNTMVGYHAVPVIVDAYFKGFDGFDAELAFEAMKTSALLDEEGLDFVKERGYIPADSQVESVAKALEYAIDDWCIAQMAKALGKTEDYELFSKRAKYYENYFDKNIHFMRGKMEDKTWRTPFNPISSQHEKDDFCEGNSWQYSWLAPHDVEGLIEIHGGEEAFITKLDSLFTIPSDQVEGASSDISGLIGQYAHGNEPSHHIIYLYSYVGQQWKTAEKVREICTTMYTNQPDGLCGNEDCGQMSAWYVLSSMGMYPVNPANGAYVFGSPILNKTEIVISDKKSFKIIAENNSEKNLYIQSVELNGKPYTKSFITHKEIMAGGELIFKMGNTPNTTFGKNINNRPKSVIY